MPYFSQVAPWLTQILKLPFINLCHWIVWHSHRYLHRFLCPKTSGIDLNRHTQTHIKWLFHSQPTVLLGWPVSTGHPTPHPQILVIHSSHNSPRKLFEGLNAFAKLSRVNYPSIETFFLMKQWLESSVGFHQTLLYPLPQRFAKVWQIPAQQGSLSIPTLSEVSLQVQPSSRFLAMHLTTLKVHI